MAAVSPRTLPRNAYCGRKIHVMMISKVVVYSVLPSPLEVSLCIDRSPSVHKHDGVPHLVDLPPCRVYLLKKANL